MVRVIVLLFVVVLTSCSVVSFRIENDVIAGTDENFTNAAEIKGHLVQEEQNPLRGLYEGLPDLEYLLKEPNIGKITVWEFGLRQDIYTPSDLRNSEIIPEDNPYAGTLTLDLRRVNRSKFRRSATTLRLGSSGRWSLADKTQTWVHEALDSMGRNQKIPKGWHHQIKSEPVVNLDMEYSMRYPMVRFTLAENTLALRLGTIRTELEYILGLRAGHNLPNYLEEASDCFKVYAKFDVFNQLRAHNIYYRGGVFRDSPHTVDMEHHVIGLRTGVILGYGDYRGGLEYIRQSRDYAEQKRGMHDYGLLSFGVDW